MQMRFSHIFFFALIALFWGGSFLAVRYSIDIYPPFAAAAMRVGSASLIMFVLMMYQQRNKVDNHTKLTLMGIGLFWIGLPWALLFWGQQYIAPAMAGIINAMTPLFTVVFATLVVRHEKSAWNKWLGVLLGFCGVIVIFAPEVLRREISQIQGMLAVLGMAASYAVGIVWLKTVAHRVTPAAAFFYQSIGALALLIPLSLFTEWNALISADWLSPKGVMSVLYLGIFGTALAQLMFFVIVRDLGSVVASAVTYLPPVVAVILDRMVYGTFISVGAMIGAAMILIGVWLTHARPGKKKKLPSYVEEGVSAADD